MSGAGENETVDSAFRPDFRTRDDLPSDFDALPEEARAKLLEERLRLLHVYGQHGPHGPVEIVGNRAALTVLRDTIDAVLRGEYRADLPRVPSSSPAENHTSAMTTDGEGFRLMVHLADEPWGHPAWETRPLPYSDPTMHGLPDPRYAIELLKIALRKANAALFKRGAKPVPMPDLAPGFGTDGERS